MNHNTEQILYEVNRAIIKFRGIYSEWSKKHNISYNEMLVLYTIREHGYCTQKQICDRYLLPRQTMNNVMLKMRRSGYLQINEEYCDGKEKAFSLTKKGEEYAEGFLNSLNAVETQAVEQMGEEKIYEMINLLKEYDRVLGKALEENE